MPSNCCFLLALVAVISEAPSEPEPRWLEAICRNIPNKPFPCCVSTVICNLLAGAKRASPGKVTVGRDLAVTVWPKLIVLTGIAWGGQAFGPGAARNGPGEVTTNFPRFRRPEQQESNS